MASIESNRTAATGAAGATTWPNAPTGPSTIAPTRSNAAPAGGRERAMLFPPALRGVHARSGIAGTRAPPSPLIGDDPGQPAPGVAPVGLHRALGRYGIARGDRADDR